MTRIRLIPLCVVSLLACVALVTGLLVQKQGPQITLEQCKRLQPGMTEDEVAAILGGRCDYVDDPRTYACGCGPGESSAMRWRGHQGLIEARFDDDGKLTTAYFLFRSTPSVWRRIRVFLGLEPLGLYGTGNEFPTSP